MEHDWILDVLSDLRTYAERNHLPRLADQLSDTTLLAALEISSTSESGDVASERRFRIERRSSTIEILNEPIAS